MVTLYDNVLAGQISDNPLSSGATTINSAAFANLSAVTGADIMWITLYPDASGGAPEIVKVTAHTASATSVTVVRGQQGTTARAHNLNTVWKHAVTASDLDRFAVGVTGYESTGGAVTLPDATLTTVDAISVTTPAAGMALVAALLQYEASGVTFNGDDISIIASTTATGGTPFPIAGALSHVLEDNVVGPQKGEVHLVPLALGANTITLSATGTRTGLATGGTVTVVSGARLILLGTF